MPVLSTEDRGRAIGYLESGRTVRTVAELFHVSTPTISKLYRRYRHTGSVKDRPRSGRPKVTTLVENRRIRALALRRRFVTAPALRSQIHEARGQGARHVSKQSINRLHTQGIKSRNPGQKYRSHAHLHTENQDYGWQRIMTDGQGLNGVEYCSRMSPV